MKQAIMLFLVGSMALLIGCSSGNLEDVKAHAQIRWVELGYDSAVYEGFQWGFGGLGTSYGGANVWYTLTRKNTSGKVTYTGALQRWGDEYHNTYLRSIDAVKSD